MARVVDINGIFRVSGHGETVYPSFETDMPGLIEEKLAYRIDGYPIIPDPRVGILSLEGEWISRRSWSFFREFENPEKESDRHFLQIERLTSDACISINDIQVAELAPGLDFLIDITDAVKSGQNSLLIQQEPVQPLDGDNMFSNAGFCGKILAPGLGGIRLRSVSDALLLDFYPYARPSGNGALVTCRTKTDIFASGRYVFNYHVVCDDEVIAAHAFIERLTPSTISRIHTFEMEGLANWNPASNSGVSKLGPDWEKNKRPIYQVVLTIERAGVRCDRQTKNMGCIRREYFRPAGAISAFSYCPVINDVPVYIQGAVWRAKPLSSRPLELELRMMADGGVNLLRVVGGVECPEFYDLCDSIGIMVWQTLPVPRELSDEAIANTAEVCRRIILSLRSHPCITFWGGDGCEYKGKTLDVNHPALYPMSDAHSELDVDRSLLPISPFGPVTDSSIQWLGRGICYDAKSPDRYLGPFDNAEYNIRDDALLRSAAGIQSFTCEADYKFMCANLPEWPPTTGNCLWAIQPGGGAMSSALEESFTGPVKEEDFPWYRMFTRYLQAHVLKRMIESAAKRDCAGIIARSAVGDSIYSDALADGTVPKPAYYAMRAAFKTPSVIAALPKEAFKLGEKLSINLFVCSNEKAIYNINAKLIDIEGETLSEEFYNISAESGPNLAGTFEANMPDKEGAVTLRLLLSINGKNVGWNDYVLVIYEGEHPLEPLKTLPKAIIKVTKPTYFEPFETGEMFAGVEIVNDSPYTAMGFSVCSPYDMEIDDNGCFALSTLLPKANFRVRIKNTNSPLSTTNGWEHFSVEGLNVKAVIE